MNIKLVDLTCALIGCIVSTLLIYGDFKHVVAAAIVLPLGTVLCAGIRIGEESLENNDDG